jgi:ATP/maltotriose-dependent transcriptional regulator MalT
MPKVPMYTLSWLFTKETYELYQTRDRGILGIDPESPEWFAWLDQVSSFAFSGKRGHYTARKETKQRGDRYWYAYLATSEQLMKKYLGKTADLSLARLEQIADILSVAQSTRVQGEKAKPLQLAQSNFLTPPSIFPAAAAKSGVEIAKPPMFVQHRTPLYPLLATKLHVLRPSTHLVPRAHLVERLQQVVACALTLVSAPAGFGKTTLLTQWIAQSELPVAWLSLEAEDNDPARFLSYLIAALQTLDAQLGTTALTLLHTPQPPSPEAVLSVLVSELTSSGIIEFALVLDDYHVISAESIQRGMTFLLEHLPPQMHLVLATRVDPPLALARLRVQGQLTEVRTADLRFGAAETSAFLQTVMGLNLPPEAIATLDRRTEGWIVGLQLAGLSLQGRVDFAGFLAAFSGSHRFVLDYLSEEVLWRQSAVVQSFLLSTCILERLSGPLCDAVREQEGSQAMLETLERANLFVVALDDERGWYRYHHLFAEVLRSHLQHIEPTLPPELHRRASAWYEQHELSMEAVRNALAIPDVELAARLIEPIVLPVTFQGQLFTVLEWMNALPKALIHSHPRLSVYYARLLVYTNQFEAAEELLQVVEQRIQEELPAQQAQAILGWVLSNRALIAVFFSGDVERAVSLALQALTLLPEAEFVPRASNIVLTAMAYLVSGDVTSNTEHEVAAADALIRPTGNPFAIVGSIIIQASLHVMQGRLRLASATYQQVVHVIPQTEVLQTLFTSFSYYFGLGDLLREWNKLEAAERHLVQGMALIKETQTLDPFVALLGYTALAWLQQARGSNSQAIATLDALARLSEQRHYTSQWLAQAKAVRAHLELVQGNLPAAVRWAEASGLSTEDEDLPYPREREYLILARIRIAQGREDSTTPYLEDVLRLLDRLLLDAESKARINSVLEILVLRALALEVHGNRTGALATLERALLFAAPEGYIRLFVDEGTPMLALLRQTQPLSKVPGYVATLLIAFGEQHISELPSTSARPSPLAEPLTEREREVLRLLLAGASNREIARRLVVSVNTVKRHVYNLCGKLGVKSRTQTIARARTLNLL